MKKRLIITVALIVVIVLGLYTVVNQQHDDSGPGIAETNEAALMTYQHIPASLQEAMTEEDVALILDLEFAYMKKAGLMNEKLPQGSIESQPELDREPMVQFIMSETARRQKSFSKQAILEVLAAEDVYLRQEGIVEE